MSSDLILGWISVSAAIICFGSFGVPIKSKPVRDANIHPFVFQTYKSFWVFMTAWLVLTWRPFNFTWWGIVSAIFWVPGGTAYVIGVEHAGLGINQALSSSCIVIVSTAWGFLFFHESIKSIPLAILAFLMLVMGVTLMAYFSVPEESPSLEKSRSNSSLDSGEDGLMESDNTLLPRTDVIGVNVDQLPEPDTIMPTMKSQSKNKPRHHSLVLGLCASAFNGLWGGSVMVPLKFAKGSSTSGIDFVLSFGIGVAIITSVMWIVFAIVKIGILKEPLPSLELRVMWFYGSIAGITWSIGNFMSMYAVIILGEAVGYSACQAAIMVSGLWGLLYFKETQRGTVFWLLGAVCCTGGIIILSQVAG